MDESQRLRRTRLERVFRTRRDNLRAQARAYGSAAGLSRALGKSPQYVNQIMGPNPTRPIGESSAREIEVLLGLPPGWLDITR